MLACNPGTLEAEDQWFKNRAAGKLGLYEICFKQKLEYFHCLLYTAEMQSSQESSTYLSEAPST
jgi:hypothetical protein